MIAYTGKQLARILSALDNETRNPASKAAALAAIRRHADEMRLTVEDILEAAAGLLDERMSAAEFRATLHDETPTDEDTMIDETDHADEPTETQTTEDTMIEEPATDAADETDEPTAIHIDDIGDSNHPIAVANAASWPTPPEKQTAKQQLVAACERVLAEYELDEDLQTTLRAAIDRAGGQRAAKVREPRAPREPGQGPREGTKEALVIEMLRRDEGTTIAELCESTGWQQHTVRGYFAGGLAKKHGLHVISEKPEKGQPRIYRLAAPVEVGVTTTAK